MGFKYKMFKSIPADNVEADLVRSVAAAMNNGVTSDRLLDIIHQMNRIVAGKGAVSIASSKEVTYSDDQPYVDPRSDKTKVYREPVGPKHMKIRRDIKIRDLFDTYKLEGQSVGDMTMGELIEVRARIHERLDKDTKSVRVIDAILNRAANATSDRTVRSIMRVGTFKDIIDGVEGEKDAA